MNAPSGLLCVFAKPPRPGEVKTRLASALGPDAATRLATAFLRDTWSSVRAVPWARAVLASTSDDPDALGLDAEDPLWAQGDGDLGERMERVLRRALTEAPWAMALGADSPGMPHALLEAARAALTDHDAVLGPTPDGGYYLLGLRRCPPGALRGLPWSQPDTRAATRARLEALGLTVAELPPFFDVDTAEDLPRLATWLRRAPDAAPATRAALAAIAPDLRPRLSVIVPTLNESARIADTLRDLGLQEGVDEVIVADGGSTDDTPTVVARFPEVHCVDAPRGRARQLNAGASVATGEVLLFLHADVTLPPNAARHVAMVLADPRNLAGAFRTWTVPDGPSRIGPLLHLADVRSRLTRHPYGDQAIFVRRDAFDALGGFPDLPLMEDYAFSRALAQRGRIGLARARVQVSGRRFVHRPLFYTAVMWTYPALFRWGVSAATLKRWYADVR